MVVALDKDALNNVRVGDVANVTMALIDRMQGADIAPAAVVAAVSALFLLVCERYGVRPPDAFSVVDNIMNHAAGRRAEFAAAAQYLEEEL